MAVYIVSYDLLRPGQDYKDLIAQLNTYPTRWHIQESVWIIQTAQTSTELREALMPFLDSNDKIFVGKLAGHAAWAGYSEQGNEWLLDLLTKTVA